MGAVDRRVGFWYKTDTIDSIQLNERKKRIARTRMGRAIATTLQNPNSASGHRVGGKGCEPLVVALGSLGWASFPLHRSG